MQLLCKNHAFQMFMRNFQCNMRNLLCNFMCFPFLSDQIGVLLIGVLPITFLCNFTQDYHPPVFFFVTCSKVFLQCYFFTYGAILGPCQSTVGFDVKVIEHRRLAIKIINVAKTL